MHQPALSPKHRAGVFGMGGAVAGFDLKGGWLQRDARSMEGAKTCSLPSALL